MVAPVRMELIMLGEFVRHGVVIEGAVFKVA
jgi:hypothetical protein